MTVWEILLVAGVPSTIFSAALSILVWWFKRQIEQRDSKREKEESEREHNRQLMADERDRNYEKIMRMIMQTGRASYVLARATAKAVQRIPEAKCNGDMTKALEQAEEFQREEQDFLINAGVAHLFGNEHKLD